MSGFIDFRQLLDVVAEVLKDGKISQTDAPAVVSYVEELFEMHVRPYDIPGVPPIAEAFVDDLLKGLIKPGVEALFEREALFDRFLGPDDDPGVSV